MRLSKHESKNPSFFWSYLVQNETTDSTIFFKVLGPYNKDIGDGRVGDPSLATTDNIVAIDLLGNGFHTSWIWTVVRFSETKATDKFTTG